MPREKAIADALYTARQARASGGYQQLGHYHLTPHKMRIRKVHVGPIHSHVAGRTDHLNMHVRSGSYVLPADIVSSLGEGNTMTGFKVAKNLFMQPFYGKPEAGSGSPYGADGLPYGAPSPKRASGGRAEESLVPIVAAGGEFVIPPEAVIHRGHGSLEDGHKILDLFVKKQRARTIKTLKALPGPKKN